MTIDTTKLKVCALANLEGSGVEGPDAHDAMVEFEALASPATVLALLDEIERMSQRLFFVDIVHGPKAELRWKAQAEQVRKLKAENEVLHSQVAALQGDPNSWQSGYTEGRRMGTKTNLDEIEYLRGKVELVTAERDARMRQVETATADVYALREALCAVVTGECGQSLLDKFDSGQGSATDDGKAWMSARDLISKKTCP